MLLDRKVGKQYSTRDDLIYVLATSIDKDAAMLFLTEDAFKQHVMTAHLQTSIWCHEANPKLDDPIGHGWTRGENDQWKPKMYENQRAPLELIDIIPLYCIQ